MFLNLENHTIYYIASVLFVVLSLLFLVIKTLKKLEVSRVKTASKRKRFDSTTSDTPLAEPNRVAKEIALDNIEWRFKTYRRVILPFLIVVLVPLLLLPVLSDTHSSYVSLLLAVTSVVVGIAAKPVIENVIAGLVLTTGYPLRNGDTVTVDGLYGSVERIALTYTIIKVWDWKRYIIPNIQLLNKEFLNHSYMDGYIWAYCEFTVAPQSDLKLVEELAMQSCAASKFFADYEDPKFWVMSINRDCITCWIAGWANSPSEAWSLKHDTMMGIAHRFNQNNIEFQSHNIYVNRENSYAHSS